MRNGSTERPEASFGPAPQVLFLVDPSRRGNGSRRMGSDPCQSREILRVGRRRDEGEIRCIAGVNGGEVRGDAESPRRRPHGFRSQFLRRWRQRRRSLRKRSSFLPPPPVAQVVAAAHHVVFDDGVHPGTPEARTAKAEVETPISRVAGFQSPQAAVSPGVKGDEEPSKSATPRAHLPEGAAQEPFLVALVSKKFDDSTFRGDSAETTFVPSTGSPSMSPSPFHYDSRSPTAEIIRPESMETSFDGTFGSSSTAARVPPIHKFNDSLPRTLADHVLECDSDLPSSRGIPQEYAGLPVFDLTQCAPRPSPRGGKVKLPKGKPAKLEPENPDFRVGRLRIPMERKEPPFYGVHCGKLASPREIGGSGARVFTVPASPRAPVANPRICVEKRVRFGEETAVEVEKEDVRKIQAWRDATSVSVHTFFQGIQKRCGEVQERFDKVLEELAEPVKCDLNLKVVARGIIDYAETLRESRETVFIFIYIYIQFCTIHDSFYRPICFIDRFGPQGPPKRIPRTENPQNRIQDRQKWCSVARERDVES